MSARRTAATVFHGVGTRPMGGEPMAVVDSQLKVRGLAGLRAVGASIMPALVSANTNATAENAADTLCAAA